LYQRDLRGRSGNRTPQGGGIDVVDEAPPPVDLHHRDPLAVRALELRVAVDGDLAQLEAELVPGRLDDRERAVAEVAALRVVDDYVGR
jgi:hypothetical protein